MALFITIIMLHKNNSEINLKNGKRQGIFTKLVTILSTQFIWVMVVELTEMYKQIQKPQHPQFFGNQKIGVEVKKGM